MAKISLKALIARARIATPLPQADVALSHEAAEVELAAAEAAVAEAETRYRAGLVDADDDALRQLAQTQADAGLRRDRARALVDRFDAQLAAIRAAEERAAEDERVAAVGRIVGAADTAMAEFRTAVERDVPMMIAAARGLLDLAGAAQHSRAAAISTLKDVGDERMPASIESFRSVAGRPERTLSVEAVELWVDDRGDPVGAQEHIILSSDNTGWLKRPNATHGRRFTRRRTFEMSTYLPSTSTRHAVSLTEALPDIVAALARLELPAEPQEGERRPQVRLRPISDAFEVTRRVP